MTHFSRTATVFCTAAFAALSLAGQTGPLTIEQALRLAKENNGTVRSALLGYRAAQASTRAALSEFLPTVTPSASQQSGRTETYTGLLKGGSNVDELSSQISAAWQLLDSGGRRLNVSQAKFSQQASQFDSLQTLRSTLFDVESRFYEVLRSQELLRVQDRQVDRARVIYDQTKFRASDEIGDAPRKDIKQAEADYLNAQVSQLQARTQISTSQANLKAVLGLGASSLPSLEEPPAKEFVPLPFTLDEAVKEALDSRADLLADRRRVDVSRTRVSIARLDGGPRWSVDASYTRTFSETPAQQSLLTFAVSYPLYDGERARESVNVQKLNLEASLASLTQSERDARAEIESAYASYTQNLLRLEAARKALDAAQENYRSAVESQKEGASTLIEVLTAQVTLTTAESNLVEARYDTILSDARLSLVLGRVMPGEAD